MEVILRLELSYHGEPYTEHQVEIEVPDIGRDLEISIGENVVRNAANVAIAV